MVDLIIHNDLRLVELLSSSLLQLIVLRIFFLFRWIDKLSPSIFRHWAWDTIFLVVVVVENDDKKCASQNVKKTMLTNNDENTENVEGSELFDYL